MTVNLTGTRLSGLLLAATSGAALNDQPIPGPYEWSVNLDETATDGTEITDVMGNGYAVRIKVPSDNATGAYYWMAEEPEITATTATWLDPGNAEWVFLPFGYKLIVAASIPAP